MLNGISALNGYTGNEETAEETFIVFRVINAV